MTTARASTARLVEASGTVEVVDMSGTSHILQHGARVAEGETVRTGGDGHARLLVDDHAVIDLAADSQLRMSPSRNGSSIALRAGRLWARVTTLFGNDRFEVTTDNAVAGVRGTSFFTEVEGASTTVSVEAGSVEVRAHTGEVARLGAAERAFVTQHLERSKVDNGAFERLRERTVARERDHLEGVRSGLGQEIGRAHEDYRDDARLRDTLREIMRNRRDGALDIDPGIARRLRDRLEELRALRRARQ
jgi:hypothetical protein